MLAQGPVIDMRRSLVDVCSNGATLVVISKEAIAVAEAAHAATAAAREASAAAKEGELPSPSLVKKASVSLGRLLQADDDFREWAAMNQPQLEIFRTAVRQTERRLDHANHASDSPPWAGLPSYAFGASGGTIPDESPTVAPPIPPPIPPPRPPAVPPTPSAPPPPIPEKLLQLRRPRGKEDSFSSSSERAAIEEARYMS